MQCWGMDGKPLYSNSHKQLTPLWKRIWQWFFRPKMTESNIETFDVGFCYCHGGWEKKFNVVHRYDCKYFDPKIGI